MAKKTRAARKATTTSRQQKAGINTKDATDAIQDLIRRIKETKTKDTNWNVFERADVEVAEHLLSGALKKIACPPTQSFPKIKKRTWRHE